MEIMGLNGICSNFMGFTGRYAFAIKSGDLTVKHTYPLVNVYITMENHHI
jgi:hypothetical protein